MTIAPAPVSQRVRLEVLDRIVRGEWAEGSPLPSEAAMCREFGTSRGTVRRALAALRSEGVVVGGRGRAPVVGRLVLARPLESTGSFTEWAISQGRAPGHRLLALDRRPASPEVAGRLDIPEGAAVVELVRARTLDGMVVLLERASFVADVGRLLVGSDSGATGVDGPRSVVGVLAARGVTLTPTRHLIDAIGANRLDAEALQVAPGTPVLRDRTSWTDASGRCVEVSDVRYRSERAAIGFGAG